MGEQDTGSAASDPTTEASPKMIAEIESYLKQQAQPRTSVMDEYAAAEYIGCSVSWLRNKRRSSTTPPFVKVGKNVRYRIESLDEWLRQQEVKH